MKELHNDEQASKWNSKEVMNEVRNANSNMDVRRGNEAKAKSEE